VNILLEQIKKNRHRSKAHELGYKLAIIIKVIGQSSRSPAFSVFFKVLQDHEDQKKIQTQQKFIAKPAKKIGDVLNFSCLNYLRGKLKKTCFFGCFWFTTNTNAMFLNHAYVNYRVSSLYQVSSKSIDPCQLVMFLIWNEE
jgi:hypothetical protein